METPELPIEIVTYILGFLHLPDRKEASLVCRIWNDASQHPRFQRNLLFRFPATRSSLELIQGLGSRKHCSLVISNLDGSALSRDVLQQVGLHLGPRLESLVLQGSSLTEASLLGLLPQLTGLRRLELQGLDSLFMAGTFLWREEQRQQVRTALAGLEELDLSGLRYLSDITFNRLTGCTPRLRRLSLASCNIASGLNPDSDGPLNLDHNGSAASSALLSFQNVMRLLRDQAATLEGLDFSNTSITPWMLHSITRVGGLRLKELCLRKCMNLTDYAVEDLCQCQPGLTSLDLTGCIMLNQRAALAVTQGLRHIRHYSSSAIEDMGFVDNLLCLPELRSLSLSMQSCRLPRMEDVVSGLPPRTHLESLSFHWCTITIGDLHMLNLAQLLAVRLRELNMRSCVLTDRNMCTINTYLQGLVVLRLHACIEITDWGLLGMENQTQAMEVPLEVFREQEWPSLLALRRLQELEIESCPKVTDCSITQVLRHPDLHRLSLDMYTGYITDASVESVARHCRGLTSLKLIGPHVTNRFIARAAPHLTRLQRLYLYSCAITDRSLSILAQHCKRLCTLNITFKRGISQRAMKRLQSQLPYLEDVYAVKLD